MMQFGAMNWFGSFIRKLTQNIGLYHPRDLHPCSDFWRQGNILYSHFTKVIRILHDGQVADKCGSISFYSTLRHV